MTIVNHEAYVSLEVAKLLKDAGFDWETFSHWAESDVNNPDFKFSGLSDKPILYDGYILIDEEIYTGRKKDWNNYNNECPLIYNYSAPTFDVAQRWLREVKNIDVYIFPTTNTKRECVYQVGIRTFGRTLWIPGQPSTAQYDTYEGALEEGIKQALELILEKEK